MPYFILEEPMPKITLKGAKAVTKDLDRLAALFETEAPALGLPEHIATDAAYRLDLLSDHIEKHAGAQPGVVAEDTVVEASGEDVVEASEDEEGKEAAKASDEDDAEEASDEDAEEASKKAMLLKAAAELRQAGVGVFSDREILDMARQLKELENELAEARVELQKAAGKLLAKEKKLDRAYKKQVKELGDGLPETLKGQGDAVHETGELLLAWQKIRAAKPATVSDVQAGVIEKAEAKLGKAVADALDDMFEAVKKERQGWRAASFKLKELEVTASAEKQAGLMDWMERVHQFFDKLFAPLKRLLDRASAVILGSRDDVKDALSAYEAAVNAAGKTASDVQAEDADADEASDEAEASKKATEVNPAHGYDLFG